MASEGGVVEFDDECVGEEDGFNGGDIVCVVRVQLFIC